MCDSQYFSQVMGLSPLRNTHIFHDDPTKRMCYKYDASALAIQSAELQCLQQIFGVCAYVALVCRPAEKVRDHGIISPCEDP